MSEKRRSSGQGRAGRSDGGGQQRRGQGAGKGKGGGKGQTGKGKGRGGPPVDPNVNAKVTALEGPLAKVLDRLPETQRRVLELRMGLVDGHPKNLAAVARELGMTMHEAKQVEERAFEHIREVVPLDRLSKLLKG